MTKVNHQQYDAFKRFDADTDNAFETVKPQERKVTRRKSSRKAKSTASVDLQAAPAMARSKVKPSSGVRRSASKFIRETDRLPPEALNESLFGHDDYQFRQGFNFSRFADGDDVSDLSVGTLNDLSREIDEQVPGVFSDRHLIQEIRRAIERDSVVSSSVHKIQMTAKNGIVVLKGTVASEEEQMIIEDKAVALAGFGQVVNQLEVIEDIQDIIE